MTSNATQIRKFSMLMLFSWDSTEEGSADVFQRFRSSFSSDLDGLDEVWDEVTRRVGGVIEERATIDTEVQRLSPRWKIERMALVDRNILRLGVWEIWMDKQSALQVINDLVDLSKEYGQKTTPGFVNGLLDQLCRDHSIAIGRK